MQRIINRNKVTRTKSYSNAGPHYRKQGAGLEGIAYAGEEPPKRKVCEKRKRCKTPVGFARWDAKYGQINVPIDIFRT